jgi:DNA/RNA endonuclease YhcR with UshA esterase domain
MKLKAVFLCGLFGLLFLALSACSHTIPPDEAAKHVGEVITVTGKVVAVSMARRGNTFLNFGGRYPNQVFTAVMFPASTNRELISKAYQFEGKTVAITGTIQLYRDKPEIILREQAQIREVQ